MPSTAIWRYRRFAPREGYAGDATDKSMSLYSRILREREGLSVLPASTAGLIGLLERHRQEPFPGDRYVVVVTGKRT